MNRFTEEFGSVNCADLLGCHLGTPEGQQTFTEGKLWKRCMAYTGRYPTNPAKPSAPTGATACHAIKAVRWDNSPVTRSMNGTS